MIKELEKQEAVYLWNNYYQGTFMPSDFDELLKTDDIIKHENWKKEIQEIKKRINTDLFESFVTKYKKSSITHTVNELETYIKEGKQYLKLSLCVNPANPHFMACFLLDMDYTVHYLCVDSKIEIDTLTYQELNTVYKKYKQLMPPPLDFVEEFNRMNAELTELTGKNVDRTAYQAWFKLVPNIKLDIDFARAYNAYQIEGEALFDTPKEHHDDVFHYIPVD